MKNEDCYETTELETYYTGYREGINMTLPLIKSKNLKEVIAHTKLNNIKHGDSIIVKTVSLTTNKIIRRW